MSNLPLVTEEARNYVRDLATKLNDLTLNTPSIRRGSVSSDINDLRGRIDQERKRWDWSE